MVENILFGLKLRPIPQALYQMFRPINFVQTTYSSGPKNNIACLSKNKRSTSLGLLMLELCVARLCALRPHAPSLCANGVMYAEATQAYEPGHSCCITFSILLRLGHQSGLCTSGLRLLCLSPQFGASSNFNIIKLHNNYKNKILNSIRFT